MFRKRRKQKVTWFPLLGFGYGDSQNTWNVTGLASLSNTDQELLKIVPLVWDAPLESAGAGGSDQAHQLVDFVGNEYSLKRIVGKFLAWIDSETNTGANGPQAIQVVMGLFVARADDSSGALGQDVPIGFGGADTASLYSPDHLDTAREPWIFRRRWVLGNNLFGGDGSDADHPVQGAHYFPFTTASGYGAGIFDGPNVDAKIGRRIGNDDRLFMAISVKPFPLGFEWNSTANFALRWSFDARVLGTLRKARNRSTF